jgi:hypothetical protein
VPRRKRLRGQPAPMHAPVCSTHARGLAARSIYFLLSPKMQRAPSALFFMQSFFAALMFSSAWWSCRRQRTSRQRQKMIVHARACAHTPARLHAHARAPAHTRIRARGAPARRAASHGSNAWAGGRRGQQTHNAALLLGGEVVHVLDGHPLGQPGGMQLEASDQQREHCDGLP